MTTRITMDSTEKEVTFHVTDDTGRDQTATMPRYPRAGSEQYVKFADLLDVMMYQWENRRGDRKGLPYTDPAEKCYTRAGD